MDLTWTYQPDALPLVALAAASYPLALLAGVRADLYGLPGGRLLRGLLATDLAALLASGLVLGGALLVGADLGPVVERSGITLLPTHWLVEMADLAVVAALLGSAVFPVHLFITAVEGWRHLTAARLLQDGYPADQAGRIVRDRSPLLGPLVVSLLAALPLVELWGTPRFFGYGLATPCLVGLCVWMAEQPTAALATIHPALRQALAADEARG